MIINNYSNSRLCFLRILMFFKVVPQKFVVFVQSILVSPDKHEIKPSKSKFLNLTYKIQKSLPLVSFNQYFPITFIIYRWCILTCYFCRSINSTLDKNLSVSQNLLSKSSSINFREFLWTYQYIPS